MNKLLHQLSLTIKGGTCLLGLISFSNILIAPAQAQQAVVRAAVTLVRPSGAYQSLSSEVTLPPGLFFNSGNNPTLTVTPNLINLGTNNESIGSLSIEAGSVTSITTLNNNESVSLTGQVQPSVNTFTQIDELGTSIQSGSQTSGVIGAME